MKKSAVLAIASIFFLASAARGQQKAAEPSPPPQSKPAAPELKPDVALDLVKAQKELYELLLQMKNIEAQYQATQRQFNEKQTALREKTSSALERSGIDKAKFDLNPETLVITPKPAAAPAKNPMANPGKPIPPAPTKKEN